MIRKHVAVLILAGVPLFFPALAHADIIFHAPYGTVDQIRTIPDPRPLNTSPPTPADMPTWHDLFDTGSATAP